VEGGGGVLAPEGSFPTQRLIRRRDRYCLAGRACPVDSRALSSPGVVVRLRGGARRGSNQPAATAAALHANWHWLAPAGPVLQALTDLPQTKKS
jgi:hypothetical protein